MAEGARAAINRLKEVAPPPQRLATRLNKVCDSLDALSEPIQAITGSLQQTTAEVTKAMQQIGAAASQLDAASRESREQQALILRHVSEAAEQFRQALGAAGETLRQDKAVLAELESQARESSAEAVRVHEAANRVLQTFTDITRELTALVRAASAAVARRTCRGEGKMSTNLDGRIGEQHTAYRRGLVLGLTMAEVGILIIFILLLLIAFDYLQRDEILRPFANKTPVEPARVEALLHAEAALEEIGEALGVAPAELPDDFTRLVRVVDAGRAKPWRTNGVIGGAGASQGNGACGCARRARGAGDGGGTRRPSGGGASSR